MTTSLSLRDVYLFSNLSETRLAEVTQQLKSRKLEAGEVLFNMGEPGDELFLVSVGQVAIYAPSAENPGQEKPIRIFREGEVLGEMALVDNKPRSLSARALQSAEVLALGVEDFRRLVGDDVDLAFAVMRGLSDRIRYTTDFLNSVRDRVSQVTRGDYNAADFNNQVQAWVQKVAEGQYDPSDAQAKAKYRDEALTALAAEFAQMALQVKQREETLRKEIVRLKVEIDEVKRKEEVKRITATEDFQALKEQAKRLRAQREQDAEA